MLSLCTYSISQLMKYFSNAFLSGLSTYAANFIGHVPLYFSRPDMFCISKPYLASKNHDFPPLWVEIYLQLFCTFRKHNNFIFTVYNLLINQTDNFGITYKLLIFNPNRWHPRTKENWSRNESHCKLPPSNIDQLASYALYLICSFRSNRFSLVQ